MSGDLYGRVLDIAGGGGWDGIENAEATLAMAREKMAAEESEERARIVGIVQRALDNEAGRAFMLWLASVTIARGDTQEMLAAKDTGMYALAAARRMAEDGVFRMIMAALQGQSEESKDAQGLDADGEERGNGRRRRRKR